MEYSKEDIQRILNENDPFNSLAQAELEIVLDMLKKRKDKVASKIATLVRKHKVTKREKEEAEAEYVKLSGRIREIEDKLKLINKS